jgi:segregation and condensation protein B
MTELNENIVEMTAVVIEDEKVVQIIEAALMVAGRILTTEDLLGLFEDHERPPVTSVQKALERIAAECQLRGIELKETASGFRFQAKQEYSLYLSRLWDEKPKRYSRSLLETLALIAYRQPITRGEIEEIRGVACNSDIFKSLMEREWIRIVGHRDVPGRPALYATTRHFLDYFNMKSLDQLPSLADLKDLDSLNVEINFEEARRSIQEAASGAVTIDESVTEVRIELAADESSDVVAETSSAENESPVSVDAEPVLAASTSVH